MNKRKTLLICLVIVSFFSGAYFFTHYKIEAGKQLISECNNLKSITIYDDRIKITSSTVKRYRKTIKLVKK